MALADAAADCEGSKDPAAQAAACTAFLAEAEKNGAPANVLSMAYSLRGLARQSVGKPDDALQDFDAALRLEPDEALNHYNRGQLLLQAREDYANALISLERAVTLDAELAPAWSNKGIALLGLKRTEEALASFERAIKIEPDFGIAHANAGWAHELMGRTDEAVRAYKRAVEIDDSLRAQILSFSKLDPSSW